MSKNLEQIPFVEIVERVKELGRLREEVSGKIRGIVNDVYCHEIPRKEDWSFLLSKGYLSLVPSYSTGNVSATTGGSTLTFDSSVTIDSSMTGRRITISNSNYIYDFTFHDSTGGTITPSFMGDANASASSYSIFQNKYPLASDFDRFPKNGGLHRYYGGRMKTIPERGYDQFTSGFNSTPTDNQEYCRVIGQDTAGNYQVEIVPPNKSSGSVEYDYFRRLKPMRAETGGTVSITSSSTSVSGSGTQFLNMNTGDYLRIDALGDKSDSSWYRISAITSNSDMTISSSFANTSVAGASFTISSAPDLPTMMHMGLIYGSLTLVCADQNDPMVTGFKTEYASVLTDAKRIYKTRLYRQDVDLIAEEYHYRR